VTWGKHVIAIKLGDGLFKIQPGGDGCERVTPHGDSLIRERPLFKETPAGLRWQRCSKTAGSSSLAHAAIAGLPSETRETVFVLSQRRRGVRSLALWAWAPGLSTGRAPSRCEVS